MVAGDDEWSTLAPLEDALEEGEVSVEEESEEVASSNAEPSPSSPDSSSAEGRGGQSIGRR